jgi:hypothetical protein
VITIIVEIRAQNKSLAGSVVIDIEFSRKNDSSIPAIARGPS